MRKNASAVSTIASILVVPIGMPRSASISSMISATSRTWSALSAFGKATACTPGPITASRSRTVMRNGRLSRTTTSAPARDTISAASGTRVRALLLRGGNAVFEVEDDRVSAAPSRALDKAALRHRHEQHRAPYRQVLALHQT